MKKTEEEDIEVEIVSGESEYVPHTDEEIKQLAIDTMGGGVFGSWMLPPHDQHLMLNVFMPLALMDDIAAKKLQRDGAVHLYESMSKAGPMGINGYPIFFSFRTLDANDVERLRTKIKQIEEL